MAEEMLFGELVNGGSALVTVRDGELAIEATSREEPEAPAEVESYNT